MNIHRQVAKHVIDLIFSNNSIYMAHHYAGGTPQDKLDRTAETINEMGNSLDRQKGELTFETDAEVLLEPEDNEDLAQEATAQTEALEFAKLEKSNQYFRILEDYASEDGTPEEIARNSTLARSEFFNLSTELQDEGYLELDNGEVELTEKGTYTLEGLEYL